MAAPYPRTGTSTTTAPRREAICCEPSVLPLSATITSPEMPSRARQPSAFLTQISRVSASLRQGSTTLTSTPETGWDVVAVESVAAELITGYRRGGGEQAVGERSGRVGHQ